MKALFYTDQFLQELYYFLEERVCDHRGPIINLVLHEKDNYVEAWYQSDKKYKKFTKILKGDRQRLIKNCVNGRIYLDMEKVLRCCHADYKVHSYGVEFTDVNEGGIVTYVFNNTSINPYIDEDVQTLDGVKRVDAGSYLHARIKLALDIYQSGFGLTDYEYLGNSHPSRYVQG